MIINGWWSDFYIFFFLSFLLLSFFFADDATVTHTHAIPSEMEEDGISWAWNIFSPLFYDHKYKCFVSFVCVMKYALHKHLNGKCEFHIIIITTAHSTTRREYSSNLSKRVEKRQEQQQLKPNGSNQIINRCESNRQRNIFCVCVGMTWHFTHEGFRTHPTEMKGTKKKKRNIKKGMKQKEEDDINLLLFLFPNGCIQCRRAAAFTRPKCDLPIKKMEE